MKIFDTAKQQLVKLTNRTPGEISMYNCGPTVYGPPHIGHGRFALTYDILRRYLEWTGLKVTHVQNITDVDDKIITAAQTENVDTTIITERYENEWWQAMDKMNILRPTHQPRATNYINNMIQLIQQLVDKGNAYETSTSIYFNTTVVDNYGLLAHQNLHSLKTGASGRVETDHEKRSPLDFALWKKTDQTPHWPSPWGTGRPGWHTECVAMSLDLLGEGFDIHSGGLDLAFPHHENERAQAEALNKTFATHWIHNGFVETGGEKMSKSLNNYVSLTDFLNKIDPRVYRILVLKSHYRSPLEVNETSVKEAEKVVQKFDALYRRQTVETNKILPEVVETFVELMNNDLDTVNVMSLLFNVLKQANIMFDTGKEEASTYANTVIYLLNILGVTFQTRPVDKDTKELIYLMTEARLHKNYVTFDLIKKELISKGWCVAVKRDGTVELF